jgi:transcriptional regulator with XRE-family HTH domain
MGKMLVVDLQRFIKNKKIKQSDLGEILGVAQPSVSAVVRGEKPMPDRWVEKLKENYEDIDEFLITEDPGVGYNKKAGSFDPAMETLIETIKVANDSLSKSNEATLIALKNIDRLTSLLEKAMGMIK